jgi:hypothetical protein
MKIKEVKKILERLYFLGIKMGRDLQYGRHDKFMGDMELRNDFDKEQLSIAFYKIRKSIGVSSKRRQSKKRVTEKKREIVNK